MVTGQMQVVRYFPYFARALEVVKKLIADSGACNVHDQRFMLARNKLDTLKEATCCQDVWNVIQQVGAGVGAGVGVGVGVGLRMTYGTSSSSRCMCVCV